MNLPALSSLLESRQMSPILTRAVAIAVSLQLAQILWLATLAPVTL